MEGRLGCFRIMRAGCSASFVSPGLRPPPLPHCAEHPARMIPQCCGGATILEKGESPPASIPAVGLGCAPKRSKGGGRRPGDMSGGAYPRPTAGSEKFKQFRPIDLTQYAKEATKCIAKEVALTQSQRVYTAICPGLIGCVGCLRWCGGSAQPKKAHTSARCFWASA
jgi:hypothetical protein